MYQRLREIVQSNEAFAKFQERLPKNHYGSINANGTESEEGDIHITVDILNEFNKKFDEQKKMNKADIGTLRMK